jgi:hypothetical protein
LTRPRHQEVDQLVGPGHLAGVKVQDSFSARG